MSDIDDTKASLAAIPANTKASIAARFEKAIVEIKEAQEVPAVCVGILNAGYAAVVAMRDCPNLEDDETGRFLMECVIDRIVAASGITNGALLRTPDSGKATVH